MTWSETPKTGFLVLWPISECDKQEICKVFFYGEKNILIFTHRKNKFSELLEAETGVNKVLHLKMEAKQHFRYFYSNWSLKYL